MANTTIYPYGTNGQLPSSIGVINDLTTGGADKALSAEMGKELKQLIDAIGGGGSVNIADEISDTILASASARMVKEIYLNLQKLFDPVNGLANIAFVGTRPTWQTVAKRTYTLSFGTLVGVTSVMKDGESSAYDTTGTEMVYEGYLKLILTPSQASYAFTSVTVNGESVTATPVSGANDGSVYIEITVNGNITLAATAISGRAIDFTNSVGCTIDDLGVPIGQDLDTTIRAAAHYTLPQSITVTIGNDSVTHTYTLAPDGKTATLSIDKEDIDGDLTITATAVEDSYATLDLSSADFDGTAVDVKRDNVSLADDAHIYEDDVISIVPKNGKLVDVAASYGSTPTDITLQGNVYDGYTFTVVLAHIGEDITIEGDTEALSTYSIDVSGVTSDVGVTWNTPSSATNSITEGSAFSVTLSQVGGTGIMAIGHCTMGSDTLTPTNNTISVSHVTGNITIVANVRDLPAKVHSYAFPAVTDNSGECLDDAVNNFNLYLYNDSTKSTFGGGNTNQSNIRTNTYSNGKGDGYRLGKTGDGDRVIKVPEFGDFSLVIKDAHPVYEGSPAVVNINNQRTIWFVDRTDVTYQAADWPSSKPQQRTGQFNLYFRFMGWGQGVNQSSGYLGLELIYCNASITKVSQRLHSQGGTNGIAFPESTIEKDGETVFAHTYTFVVTFNAATLKVCAWLVDTDNNTETTTFQLCKEITIDTPLRLPFISVPNAPNQIGGLDVYNYTMDETAIATEFNATLNT